jgi:predicted dehydrogenase
VYVPVPNAVHFPRTVAALQAGNHVLCDRVPEFSFPKR